MRVTLCVVTALAVAALVAEDYRGRTRPARAFKSVASLGFVTLALVLGAHQTGAFGRWILLGLLLSAGGDFALTWPSKRAFMTGLVLFLLGHVAYVFASASVVPVREWFSFWAVLPVCASLMATLWLWPHLGTMRAAVLCYVVAITVMVVGATAVFEREGSRAACLLFGATLFYASDLSVARDRFVQPGFVNRIWGLPAYYAGQVFMAWATLALR